MRIRRGLGASAVSVWHRRFRRRDHKKENKRKERFRHLPAKPRAELERAVSSLVLLRTRLGGQTPGGGRFSFVVFFSLVILDSSAERRRRVKKKNSSHTYAHEASHSIHIRPQWGTFFRAELQNVRALPNETGKAKSWSTKTHSCPS